MDFGRLLASIVLIVCCFACFGAALSPASSLQHVECVALISSGRAGTTKLVSDIGSMDETFVINEPFREAVGLRFSENAEELVPPYKDLFSCEAYRTMPEHVLWGYPCKFTPQFHNASAECINDPEGFGRNTAYEECKRKRIRIVKTIRFFWFSELEFPQECTSQKIIHNIRHPWPLGLSIFKIGWGVHLKDVETEEDVKHTLVVQIKTRCELVMDEFEAIWKYTSEHNNVQLLNIAHVEDRTDHAGTELVFDFVFRDHDIALPKQIVDNEHMEFDKRLIEEEKRHFADFAYKGEKLLEELDADDLIEAERAVLSDNVCYALTKLYSHIVASQKLKKGEL
eukprot:m.113622 g.113622  ORF g.113622 m.113622 type:complete len:340 (-) comp12800_c0_seq4:232-1251(-)